MRANRYISMPSAAKAMPNPVRRKRQQYFEKPRSDAIVPTRFDARTVLGCALPYLLKSQPGHSCLICSCPRKVSISN